MGSNTLLLVALPERCYRCGKVTRGFVGVLAPAARGRYVFREFDDIAHALAEVVAADELRRVGVGRIKERRSRQRGRYVRNGCVHCDALLGSFPLCEGFQGLRPSMWATGLFVSAPERAVCTGESGLT